MKNACSVPSGGLTLTSCPVGNKTLLSRKPSIPDTKLLLNAMRKSPDKEITIMSYPACSKTTLAQKPCITDKSYYGSLSGSHGHSLRIRHEKSREAPLGGGLTMTYNLESTRSRHLIVDIHFYAHEHSYECTSLQSNGLPLE